ncbi:nucleotide-binding protein [Pseudomonas ficuserectae]|nr:nucleotide-binding protein [Pseudomonas ficuserectae]
MTTPDPLASWGYTCDDRTASREQAIWILGEIVLEGRGNAELNLGDEMKDRVFYSWQSDSPGNTNRNFILQALEIAIADIHKDQTTDVEPVIDRDTLGLAGSPDISHSIFEKIDAASVFVCDVSIIDLSTARSTPNPNVLVELGYAIKALGWNRIIMVMNIAYGGPDKLPFDLRSKRALTYTIEADADEKAPVRKGLTKTFVAALQLIFESHGSRKTAQASVEAAGTESPPRSTDAALFERFKTELPSKGSISFIDEHNMAGFLWRLSNLDQLSRFYHEWDDVEHEFIDAEMEKMRSQLHGLVGDYLGQIAVNTFPAYNPDFQTVPPEWEETKPEHFFSVVNRLHATAGEIVKLHNDLFRLGKMKFDR